MTVAWLTYESKHLHAGDVVDSKLFKESCGGADECVSAGDIKAFAVNFENSRIPADVVSQDGSFDISFVTDLEGFYTIAAEGAGGDTRFFAKTTLSVGHGPRDYNQTTDFELDVTPLRVGRYYSGETISLAVLHNGTPLADVDVKATIIGTGAEYSAVTNDEGVAAIEITSQGDWVFYAATEIDGKKLVSSFSIMGIH